MSLSLPYQCPKCSGTDLDRIWVGKRSGVGRHYPQYRHLIYDEHIETTCNRCGFRWPQRPADRRIDTAATFDYERLPHS